MTPDVPTLTRFLRERLAKDAERTEADVFAALVNYYEAEGDDATTLAETVTLLVADRLRPRLRADLRVKLAVVEACESAWARDLADGDPKGAEWLLGRRWALHEVCKFLAQPYADHPDYQPEWRA